MIPRLSFAQAEAALAYFADGQPTKIALPPAPDGVQLQVPAKLTVSKQWFWEMYKVCATMGFLARGGCGKIGCG
jgi:hypothetical protein